MKRLVTGLAMIVCFLFACNGSRLTDESARRIATAEFLRTCKEFHYDPNSFAGPKRTEVGGATFAYEWNDKSGSDFGILVSLHKGGVETTFLGHVPE